MKMIVIIAMIMSIVTTMFMTIRKFLTKMIMISTPMKFDMISTKNFLRIMS